MKWEFFDYFNYINCISTQSSFNALNSPVIWILSYACSKSMKTLCGFFCYMWLSACIFVKPNIWSIIVYLFWYLCSILQQFSLILIEIAINLYDIFKSTTLYTCIICSILFITGARDKLFLWEIFLFFL